MNKIWFSDEACFLLNDHINPKNFWKVRIVFVFWKCFWKCFLGSENPHSVVKCHLHLKSAQHRLALSSMLS